MATFTVYLHEITGEDGNPDFSKIGLDDYPIYDENYRAVLNKKIYDQFVNREIGQETVSMFQHAMRRFMNNHMPYFNEQYRLSLYDIDPLLTVDMLSMSDSAGTTEASGESNNISTAESLSNALSSDYPQTFMTENGNYARDGQATKANTGTTSDASETQASKQSGKSQSKTKGYSGHGPALIFQARQTLINIDMLILEQIEQQGLFFMLWNSGDEFTQGRSHYGY